MHELSVVFHMIGMLEKVKEENRVEKIETVTIELGEISTVIPDYLTDCWKWAREKHDFLKGAELLIEKLPAVTFCEDCKTRYDTIPHGKICPNCGSPHTFLVQGNEFNIKEVEAW